MEFKEIYLHSLFWIIPFFSLVWVVSVKLKNASIVDIFWGLGFVLLNFVYFSQTGDFTTRKLLLLFLVSIWGLRLSIYILSRNWGKPEDYRYQNFRKLYGEHRYWWLSFFQVFMLQAVLLWMISAPLLAVQYNSTENGITGIDIFAIFMWLIGFTFEAGGDYQLARFKANPQNKGKILQKGFWKFTRHPNYFGDALIWWSFGIFSVAAGSYLPLLSSALMTWLIIKVSGVAMLENSLKKKNPEYKNYVKKTSAFIPWFPKASVQVPE